MVFYELTHKIQASFLWNIDKRVKSASPLFVYKLFYWNLIKKEKYHTNNP